MGALELVAGLGNSGARFRGTRHNAGFLVLDELAGRHGLTFHKRKGAAEARLGDTLLVKPLTFMNLSGKAVQARAARLRLRPEELLVVHDDLDLPLGRLRFKVGGGAGGQKGVADIISGLGPNFARLKVGIGRPPAGFQAEDWVLSRFSVGEQALLDQVMRAAAEAVELALAEGVEAAMNRVNGLDLQADDSGLKIQD